MVGSLMPSLYTYLGLFFLLLLPSSQLTVASIIIYSVNCLEIWRVFLSFSSCPLIISLEEIFLSFSTNWITASLWLIIHPPSPFFTALLAVVYLFIYFFTFPWAVFIFMVQVNVCILCSTLSTLIQPPITFACPAKYPKKSPDTSPYIHPITLSLHLMLVMQL